MTKRRMFFWCLFLFMWLGAPLEGSAAQRGNANDAEQQSEEKVKASGVVVDEKGEPIPGANVLITGKSRGTVTDIDGKFSLPVPVGATLQISFIGYVTQQAEPKENLRIVLKEDSKMLEEATVVQIGYGAQRMKNVTGSVAVVDMKEIEDLPVSNLGEALSGKIPGVSVGMSSYRPGSEANITIRQSFNESKYGQAAGQVPLVVIDDVIQVDPTNGFPTLETFNALDVSEVESITILRDAAAAIYGSRASQGAIIVKTKRGKQGPPKINYNGRFMWNDAVSHGKVMNAYEYGLFNNRFWSPKQTDKKYFFSDEELEQMKNLNYDWLDKAWEKGLSTQHSLNVSGGSERATYYAGVTYYTQGANLGKQDYDRWNFRTGVDVKVAKNFKISAALSGTEQKVQTSFSKFYSGSDGYANGGEQNDYSVLLHMPKYIPWETEYEGKHYFVSPALTPNRVSGTNQNNISSWNYFAMQNSASKSETNNVSYNFDLGLTYELPWVKGLSVRGSYSKRYKFSDSEQFCSPMTLLYSTNSNVQGTHLYGEDTQWKTNNVKRSARVVYVKGMSKSYQANFYASFDRTFGLHAVSAMFSIERSEAEWKEDKQIYNDPKEGLYFGTSSSAGTFDPSNSYANRGESGTLSYLGRASYSYADKYLFQFVFRADASTKFAPENYWGFFPTASFGWVASEEKFFRDNVNWMDFLKFRFSVGKTGKDNFGAWKWMQTYEYKGDQGMIIGSGSASSAYGPGLKQSVSPSRSATWDTSIKYNFGLDTKFLKSRLSMGFDFYFDKNKDLLISLTENVPISVGGSLAEENFAAINAYGFELSLGWNARAGKDFSYGINVNAGWSDNRIKKWQESATQYPWTGHVVGKSTDNGVWGLETWKGNGGNGLLRTQDDVDAYWNYLTQLAEAAGTTPDYLGINKRENMMPGMLAYQDVRGNIQEDGSFAAPNGRISKNEDFIRLVKRSKTHGFTTNLRASWKGIGFSTQISTSWGGLRTIDRVKQSSGSSNFAWSHPVYLNDMYDLTLNPNGSYPNIQYGDNNELSDFWKINSFRCFVKNLSVSYTLPKKWMDKLNISQCKINLTGNNLWDFYNPYPKKYRNMYDSYNVTYPTLRTWSLGLTLSL